jgi:hypothetical protein
VGASSFEGLIGKTPARMRGYTSIGGIDPHRGSRPSTVPSLILFSSHSKTVICENGEIVWVKRSETFHFRNRCNGPVLRLDFFQNVLQLSRPGSA